LANSEDKLIFLRPGKGVVPKKLYVISELTASTEALKPSIMFAHAFTGCDSTSATYNRGKVRFWNMPKQSESLQAVGQIFNNARATRDIFKAGCTAFYIWFGAVPEEEKLKDLRYNMFKRAVSKNASDLRTLCPSEGAGDSILIVYMRRYKRGSARTSK